MLNFGNKEFRNLQEQVLKNAQDIETLKGRENLQIVIVEELPEEGNPNYIYLVPNNDEEEENVYDEYIWLADSEEYEKIGGVDIDLTNYVTLDSEQTITGEKTISEGKKIKFTYGTNVWWIKNGNGEIDIGTQENNLKFALDTADVKFDTNLRPYATNSKNLGSSSYAWKDLYLSNYVQIIGTDNTGIRLNASQTLQTTLNGGTNWYNVCVFDNYRIKTYAILPLVNNSYDIGSSSLIYATVYTAGLSDGINSLTVANIASKVTSTFISGTFDSNGESTIDTEQAGTPEGLFIFTYGNCQCFLRLTAAMISSADVTPIRVAIPMIYNSAAVNGWLNITKSGYILILKITDGTNHVDSGYGWTLTKTKLI